MGREVLNSVTIYEVNGTKYVGPQQVYIKKHPRFLSFVKLSIGDQEYSIAADSLLIAIERAIALVPARELECTVVANDDQIVDADV
jgi:hypothetical protein